MTVVILLFICHWFMRNSSVKELADRSPVGLLRIVWAIMIVLLAMAQVSGEQFIYFQF